MTQPSVYETSGTWPDGTRGTAIFDRATSRYRYLLTRVAGPKAETLVTFIMLNPSTADAIKNDPTITRCWTFAQRWGHRAMEVVNLFALRATDPKELRRELDPTGGKANDAHIAAACWRADVVVAAWGAHGKLHGRSGVVKHLLRPIASRVHALGFTADGEPRHPLYLRQDSPLLPFDLESR